MLTKAVAILLGVVVVVEATRDTKMFLGWQDTDLPESCSKGTIARLNFGDVTVFRNILASPPLQCGIRAAKKLLDCYGVWEKAGAVSEQPRKDEAFANCIHKDAASVITGLTHCCTSKRDRLAEANRVVAMAASSDFACKKDPNKMDTSELGDKEAAVERQGKCSVGRMAQLVNHFNTWTVTFNAKCGAGQGVHETVQQCIARKKKFALCAGEIADHVKRCCNGEETNEAINCEDAAHPDRMDMS